MNEHAALNVSDGWSRLPREASRSVSGDGTREASQAFESVILPPCASKRHLEALRAVASFAYERSPFYRRLYDQAGVRPGPGQMFSNLPLVSVRDLASSALEFRTDLTIYRVVAASGTTGRPKLMFRTAKDFEQSVRNERRLLEWATVAPGDVVAIAQPFDMWASGELIQRAAVQLGAMVVPVGRIPDEDALGILVDTRCTVLDTTPSRLRRMLQLSAQAPGSATEAVNKNETLSVTV